MGLGEELQDEGIRESHLTGGTETSDCSISALWLDCLTDASLTFDNLYLDRIEVDTVVGSDKAATISQLSEDVDCVLIAVSIFLLLSRWHQAGYGENQARRVQVLSAEIIEQGEGDVNPGG